MRLKYGECHSLKVLFGGSKDDLKRYSIRVHLANPFVKSDVVGVIIYYKYE